MSKSFDDIAASIQKEIDDNKIVEPVTVAQKPGATLDPNNAPVVQVGVKGTIMSRPGTEVVSLDTTTFQMVQCVANKPGPEKTRYAIVEKNIYPKYGNQYAASNGFRAHIITREVYTILLTVLNNTAKQIIKYRDNAERAEEQRDLYKLTVDALRKNGVID